ncbi:MULTISPECIES: DUF3281 family protein [unclassified Francisella]|uniref:DUF3281 family protein n=1 Tax=unclassified Francisella TaxID=2610885 RepID=UPI002E36235C|nr:MULTISPECIES: DUF3281 family protein [unclassified Francisella]MED7818392.1 DUF3281 family protein [Francisella sp. 19S2-4]MED7829228.1 DUF3281 family protein [Francisella sp. 19S2-10]
MNKKKLIIATFIAIISIGLTSCINKQETKELKIVSECAENICHIELAQVDVLKTTDMLGKTSEKILSKTSLNNKNDSLEWSISGGNYATAQQMSDNNLPSCENDTCSSTSNPTGYVFPVGAGSHYISVSGTVTLPDGATRTVSQSSDVIVEAPNIKTQITLTGGDYSQIPASGTGSVSGISWIANPGAITFTCPSGYGIPTNAMPPEFGTNNILKYEDATSTGVYISISPKNGRSFESLNYRAGYYYVNNNAWSTAITCVPASDVDDYL